MDLELDQLVYGSFPFRAGGYDVLARSSGCSAEVVGEVVAACRRYGQPPSSEAARPSLFALPLPSGPWAIVGVRPQGDDDRGRPGALAFHALIVARRDYRRAGSDPFAFAGAHRGDWSTATAADLPRARCRVEPVPAPDRVGADPKARRIAAAIARRRRVAVEEPGPIDELARAVWTLLPARARRRATVATWAFAAENRFDLVALPRLAGVALDRTYVAPGGIDLPDFAPNPRPRYDIRAPGAVAVATAGLVVVGALTAAWIAFGRDQGRLPPPPAPVAEEAEADPAEPPLPAGELARVRRGLDALAERFAGFDLGPPTDAGAFLARLADALHYHGPVLIPTERDAIAADPDPDKVRALAWHDQIRRFRDDQPWPGRFGSLALPRQLAAVARSFHLDPDTPPSAVPDALIAVLARPGLIRPTPLAARFPTLSDYARFLARLPRADDPAPSQPAR